MAADDRVAVVDDNLFIGIIVAGLRFFQLPLFKITKVFRRKVTRSVRSVSVVSDPDLYKLWDDLIGRYFADRIDLRDYVVVWSKRRQRRTLGSCNVKKRKVNIAQELGAVEFANWVEPVLYHELCHAVLGPDIIKRKGRRAWHGTEFKELEARHPMCRELDVWMRSGGWQRAVRSHRARLQWKRKHQNESC